MDLLDGLNPGQKEAVTTVEGPLLVHAGPGSGKTRVIVHRIAYMVLKARIPAQRILAVTFSKKAAAEMKKRLDELLGDKSPGVTVSTIHSACLRILRREGIPGLGTTFEVYDEEGQNKLIRQCMEDAGLNLQESDPRRFKGVISYIKVNMIDPDAIVPGPGERLDDTAVTVYRLYQQALKKQRSVDYDDMLVFTLRLLKEDETVLKRYQKQYKFILVDEFQDTSSLQYQIIRLLGAKHRNVCVVGDPDQTIYSWRQAEIRNTDHFRRDFPGTRVIGMDENYRSTGTIVAAANALISHNSKRKEKELFTSREEGDKISLVRTDNEDAEALYIARSVKALAARDGLRLGDFAVLYRVNAQSRALEEGFNQESIPYRLINGTPFYKRTEIADMAAWLRVMRNPADDAALQRVIKIAGKGIGEGSAASLQAYAEKMGLHLHDTLEKAASGSLPFFQKARQRAAAAHFFAVLQELRSESRHRSLVTLMNSILEKTRYQEHLKGQDDPEERWENVLELVSMAAAYDHLGPIEALSALLQKITSAADNGAGESSGDAVTFNTLHGSKGSEYPVVFIAGVEEGLLPHAKSLDDPDRMEEERRLFYVGITRAMDRSCLTYALKRNRFGEQCLCVPSRFLREIPAGLVRSKDLCTNKPAAKAPPVTNVLRDLD